MIDEKRYKEVEGVENIVEDFSNFILSEESNGYKGILVIVTNNYKNTLEIMNETYFMLTGNETLSNSLDKSVFLYDYDGLNRMIRAIENEIRITDSLGIKPKLYFYNLQNTNIEQVEFNKIFSNLINDCKFYVGKDI